MLIQKKLDVSSELEVHRFSSGIKLVRPASKAFSAKCKTLGVVSDFLRMPCSVYFETADGVIRLLNERNAEFCGFDSVPNAIGKCYFDTLSERTVSLLRYNDRVVMQEETAKLLEEDIFQENCEAQKAITLKLPWYNNHDKVIGLFGMSILMGTDALAEPLHEMAKMGFLTPSQCQSHQEEIILSRQQNACANLLMEGMTNKQIAMQLGLSPRTVEAYINNLKLKLSCKNKMELIAKLSREHARG